jgi:hypothetical protein
MIIINLSVQRTGTKSFTQFFRRAGFKTLSWVEQNNALWDIDAINGNYEKIISSSLFQEHQIFSDTPFWDLELAKYIIQTQQDVLFVYLHRNKNEWFKSMATHSKGMTFDDIKVHNFYYGREQDLEFLTSIGLDVKSLYMLDKYTHYTNWYERNHQRVLDFFSTLSDDRYFYGSLGDENIWQRMSLKFGLNRPKNLDTSHHTHQTSKQNVIDTKTQHSNLERFFGSHKIIERKS